MLRITRSGEHEGAIACQCLGHSRTGKKESQPFYISLAKSRRLGFLAHVEEDAGCQSQANVHGGNCEPSGDSGSDRNYHLSHEYNKMPRFRLGERS